MLVIARAAQAQRDAQAVASELVIRVERHDQRVPQAIDVQAAVGNTNRLAAIPIRQQRDLLLRAPSLPAQPHPAEDALLSPNELSFRGAPARSALPNCSGVKRVPMGERAVHFLWATG